MPSDQRLHPASIIFSLWKSAKIFLVPGLLLLVTSRRRSNGPFDGDWQLWFMLMMIPSTIGAVATYFTFRLSYEGRELVIRSGLFFRNERKIPYSRIQNLEAIQNPLHRLLRVVEVRVETGQGAEAEATISVLPLAAFPEMRRRVFEGRTHEDEAAEPGAAAEARPTFALPIRELLLFGFIEGRGSVLLGAFFGVLWEVGLLDSVQGLIFGENSYGRGYLRDVLRTLADGRRLSLRQIEVGGAAVAALLIFVRLLSMLWGVIRLYGFQLVRAGDDLRTSFGLLTRVSATIPRRRIQTVTVFEGPLHQLLGRAAVRVETAGGPGPGGEAEGSQDREWLAPLLKREALPALLHHVEPGLDLEALPWQGVDPRAFRRVVKTRVAAALVFSILVAWPLGPWALAVLVLALLAAVVSSRKFVACLAWATTDDVVGLRSGWLWRSLTLARTSKIQAVTGLESPFDRRVAMAQIRVDTAGAGVASHRVHIRYLPRETAFVLRHRLAAQAASSSFRW